MVNGIMINGDVLRRAHLLNSPFRKASARGFTLVELAVVLVLIAIFSSFAIISFGGTSEVKDAKLVESTQASLQSVVSQGSARLDLSPAQLVEERYDDIVNALRGNLQQTGAGDDLVSFSFSGDLFQLSLLKSGRGASYTVTNSGDVRIANLSNFPSYTVSASGTIKKVP